LGDSLAKSTRNNSPCHHEFHRHCIVNWLVRRTGCPICREIFLQEDIKIEDKKGRAEAPNDDNEEDADEELGEQGGIRGESEVLVEELEDKSHSEENVAVVVVVGQGGVEENET
jgi:hypothetical protein